MCGIPELPRSRCRIIYFVALTSVACALLSRPAAIAASAGLVIAILSLLVARAWGRAFALGFVLCDWLVLGTVLLTSGGVTTWQIVWIAPLALIELHPAHLEEWPALMAPALVLPAMLLIADPALGGSRVGGITQLAGLYLAGVAVAGLAGGGFASALAARRRARATSSAANNARHRTAPRRSSTVTASVLTNTADPRKNAATPAVPVPQHRQVDETRDRVDRTVARPSRPSRSGADPVTGLPGLETVADHLEMCMRRANEWNVALSLVCLKVSDAQDGERAAAVCARRIRRRLRHDEAAFRVRHDTFLVALLGRDRADAVALAAALEHELPGPIAARAGGQPEIVAGVTAYDGQASLQGLLCAAARAIERELAWEASSR